MRTNKLVFVILIFALSFVNCSNSKKNNKVKVGYLPMVSSLTHFVAVEKGYYKEEGLEIEANPIKTSNLIAQDLVAGHIDVGIELSIIPLLKQLEKAPNSALIFSISHINSENGFDGILVKKNSNIKKIEDIAGKRLGVFPGSTAKNTIIEIFKKRYANLELPKCIELDPPLHLQSLENGDIDALFTYEPTLTLGIVKNGYEKISNSIYALQYNPNPIGVGAVNSKWVNSNPELANKFLKAIDKSVKFIQNNPNESRQILAKATNLDKIAADNMNIMPMSESSAIDTKNLKGYLEILKQMNEIDVLPNPDDIIIK